MNNFLKIKTNIGSFSLDVELNIVNGINCLFGPSGSGKTSIINCIAGLIKPSNAKILIHGKILNDTKKKYFCPIHKRRVGYIFQDARLFPHYNVKRNLLYGNLFTKKSPKFFFKEVIDLLDLEGLLERMPTNLSGGEKQRIAIGRALLSQPNLLLMDEPLASLDQKRKDNLLEYILKINTKFEIPIFYVSHMIGEVFMLGKNISFIEKGRVSFSGSRKTALNFYNKKYSNFADASYLNGKVLKLFKSSGLTEISVDHQKILIFSTQFEKNTEIIIKIDSTDIIISKTKPKGISSLNFLRVEIVDMVEKENLICMVLRLQKDYLKAHITKKALNNLDLHKFDKCYAIIKTLSINDFVKIDFT